MSKPIVHAEASAKRWGGKPEDYLPIHDLLDSSKAAVCDNRHRALTHNSWFVSVIIEKIFGHALTNSDGKVISTREVAEWHVYEDFRMRFIPSADDYITAMTLEPWMDNGRGYPPSQAKIVEARKSEIRQPTRPAGLID